MKKSLGLIEKIIIWWRLKATPLNKIMEFIPENGKLLDLGCGFGIFSDAISKARPNLKITAIDPSRERIETAKKIINSHKIKFQKAIIDNLDENDFNCIILIDVVYLLARQELNDLLGFCFNKLATKGVLIIKTMDKRRRIRYLITKGSAFLSSAIYFSINSFSKNIAIKIMGARENRPDFLSDEKLSGLLKKAGFKVEKYDAPMILIPYPHIIYVASKDL